MMALLRSSLIIASSLAVILSGFAGAPSIAERTQQDQSWTIMVYMADDFLTSLDWQNDFNEMEAAQQAAGTDIIVLVDQYGSPNSALYRIQHDPNYLDDTIVSAPIDDDGAVISGGEVNMAEESTLSSFITYSMSSYPADHYVLVLWGHGAGWKGLCPDGADILTLPEFGNALSQATSSAARLLDLVVVDSCAEATLETLWQIHDYARYFAASENNVPFQGLPYNIVMGHLAANPSQSVEDFASTLAHDYVLWSSGNTDYSVTMGVFNLSMMEPLVNTLTAISIQGQKYDPIFHETLRAAFNSSEEYEEYFTVDFGHFMQQLLRSDLPLEIRHYAIESMLRSESVVEHFEKYESKNLVYGVKVGNASGLTIFAPSSSMADALYNDVALASTDWFAFGQLLRKDTTTIMNGPGPNVTVTSGLVNLTWQDGAETSSIWVFLNLSSGLSYVETITVDGPYITLTGVPGHLTIAASSYTGGIVTSYRTLNATLEGSVTIEVQITRDGVLVGGLSDSYDISVIAPGNVWLGPGQHPLTGADDSVLFSVSIPDDALVGDPLSITVYDESSGKLVGAKTVFVPLNTTTVSVEVIDSCECQYRDVVPLLFALLPGLLILVFALSLYYEKRKRKDRDE